MLETLYSIVPKELFEDITVFAIPIYVALIAIEVVINSLKKLRLYKFQDSAACITTGIVAVLVGGVTKVLAFLAFSWLYSLRVFDLNSHLWVYWIILFFADDFSFYWHHRASHEVRVLWAAHNCHHSSQQMNLTVALRQSWAELCYKYVFWMWLPLVGFHPLHILLFMAISPVYQFFPHTQLVPKLGPLEWLLNTPSHHRVHHASNLKYLDKNYGGILIIWDRLFGSFQEEDENEPCVYGILHNIESYNPLTIEFHEFGNLWRDLKSTPSWSDKFKYLFYPPGWRHDGEDQTVRTLRKMSG